MKPFAFIFCLAISIPHFCLAATEDTSPFHQLTASKQAFFKKIYPLVMQANAEILMQRSVVKSAFWQWQKKEAISVSNENKLKQIQASYQLPGALDTKAKWDLLLARVDTIPVSLVLAQAANESAWGKSRFALAGNNLFGQWCFKPGCGIKPLARPKGATYEVRAFSSMDKSIAAYMQNLNTNQAYHLFRELRAQARAANQKLDGKQLARGLVDYSTRRHGYVQNIQSMILTNNLQKLDIA